MVATDFAMDRLVHDGTINNAIFSHPDIYQQELEQVFARMWLFVGHESEIPRPGDFVRSRMGEEQVIVTRAPDNKVHVLLNSCAHRGNMVCRYDQGNALVFTCPFHAWTYDSAGRLVGASGQNVSQMDVSVAPGSSAITRILFSRSSSLRVLVNPSAPCFEAL